MNISRLDRPAARRLLRDTRGSTAIEYALIAAGIAAVIIAAVNTLGGSVLALYERVAAMFS